MSVHLVSRAEVLHVVEIHVHYFAGVELSSKKKKLQWETEDNDDDIDIEKTLELRQVKTAS